MPSFILRSAILGFLKAGTRSPGQAQCARCLGGSVLLFFCFVFFLPAYSYTPGTYVSIEQTEKTIHEDLPYLNTRYQPEVRASSRREGVGIDAALSEWYDSSCCLVLLILLCTIIPRGPVDPAAIGQACRFRVGHYARMILIVCCKRRVVRTYLVQTYLLYYTSWASQGGAKSVDFERPAQYYY